MICDQSSDINSREKPGKGIASVPFVTSVGDFGEISTVVGFPGC